MKSLCFRLFGSCCRLIITIILFANLVTPRIGAEETRAGQLAGKQAQKSRQVVPYTPNRLEDIVVRVQRWGLLSGTARGLYPFFGSAFPGGGLAFGGGYREFFADSAVFDIHAGYSIAGYKLVDTSLHFPAANGKLRSIIRARYQDAPQVKFFGVGNDSNKDDEVNYAYTPKGVELTEAFDAARHVRIGGSIGYYDYETGPGESSRVPSIEEVFTPAQVPGFELDTSYVVGSFFAQYDWRQAPGYTTSGGLYRVDLYDYNERGGDDAFNFRRLDIQLIQHFPIYRGNQIIALRGLGSITDVDDLQQVPFFLLPKLGGGQELRGFPDFRFLDRHRMLLTAEYRWTPSKFMDMAIFYETGKVASETSELDFSDLHDSYGIGARFHTPAYTAFRIELARSKEGTRLILGGGMVF